MTAIRIKRRQAGGVAGAPASLLDGELAFNNADAGGGFLYFGSGVKADGVTAQSVVPVGGPGYIANQIAAGVASCVPLSGGDVTHSTATVAGGAGPVSMGQVIADALALRAYGFVGDGVNDDAHAIQNLVNATAPANLVLRFPACSAKIGSTITSTGSRNITLVGNSTWFNFTTVGADGWQHGCGAPGTGRFEASGITWVAPAGNGGSAVHVSAMMMQDPCGAHALVSKCRFPLTYGSGGAITGCWQNAVDLEGCWNSTVENSQIEGNGNSNGVRLRQCEVTSPSIIPGTNFCLHATIIQGGNCAIRIDSQFQGVQVTLGNLIGVNYGVYWPAGPNDGADLLTFAATHINSQIAGVYASNVLDINTSGGVYHIHGAPVANQAWAALNLTDCLRFTLTNNTVAGTNTAGENAFVINGVVTPQAPATVVSHYPSLLANNLVFLIPGAGVLLKGTIGNVAVTGNRIESGLGIVDQSSGAAQGNQVFANFLTPISAGTAAPNWDGNYYAPGALSLTTLSSSQGIDLGCPEAAGGISGRVNLHSVATQSGQARNAYDVQLLATGGTQGTAGAGGLTINAAGGVSTSGPFAAHGTIVGYGSVTAQGGQLVAAGNQNNVYITGAAAAGGAVAMYAYGNDANIVLQALARGNATVVIGNNLANVFYLTGEAAGTSANLTTSGGNLSLGANTTLAPNATAGMIQIPVFSGPPTGTPASTGGASMGFDQSTSKLWIYNPSTSAWKGVALS